MILRTLSIPCAVMLILAPILSGCGGGGGGGDSGEAAETNEPVISPDPVFDRDEVARIIAASESLSLSPAFAPAGAAGMVEIAIDLDIDDLKGQAPQDFEPVKDPTFFGVSVGRTLPGEPETDGIADVHRFGGWLEHNYFEARAVSDAAAPLEFAHAYSMGVPTGSNPVAGSATWRGATVGLDASPQGSAPFAGSATLTVDFAPFVHLPDTATVDIVLDNLHRLGDESYAYPDIRFEDVPINDGAFGDELVTPADLTEYYARYQITGAFYGDDHEEAGGTFVIAPTEDYRDGVMLGAFGAKRGD